MVANNCKQFLHAWIAFTRFTQHFNTIIYKSQPGLWRHKLVSRISPKYTNSCLPSVHLGLWELQKFLADLLRGQAARHHVLACTQPHPTNVNLLTSSVGFSRSWTEPVGLAAVCASWFLRFSQYVGDRWEEGRAWCRSRPPPCHHILVWENEARMT